MTILMITRLANALSAARVLGLLLPMLLVASPARAQGIKGPTTCFKCHKPMARAMWETDAPFHKKSVEQLSAPKAAGFATAIGLASPTTVTGRPGDCVSCHATIVGGAPSVGVSCESCHGAASGYFTGHQEPEFFDQPPAKWMGLRNTFGDPKAIAQVCVDCHVTPDPRLKKAGHPAGEAFDPGKGIVKMVHWSSDISTKRKRTGYGPALYAQISSQAAPLVAKRLASGGGATAAAAPPAAPPKAGPAVAPPAAGGAVPAAAPAAPVAARPRTVAKAADPFDWDQPVAGLPADYAGDAGGASSAPAPVAPAAMATAPLAAASVAVTRPPSTAAELPPAPEAPALSAPASPPSAAVSAGPTPATAVVPAVRGRAVLVAAQLLKSKGAGQVVLPAPVAPREFDGPNGELLRLQDEILYLALETLRKGQP